MLYEVSNDPKLAPLSIDIPVPEIYNVKMEKCRVNAHFELTAFLYGEDDKSFTPIEDLRVIKQFSGALQFTRHNREDVDGI